VAILLGEPLQWDLHSTQASLQGTLPTHEGIEDIETAPDKDKARTPSGREGFLLDFVELKISTKVLDSQ
jgi:hypothetical protein